MKRILCILLAVTMCFSVAALDLNDASQIDTTLHDFTNYLPSTIPSVITADNLWADAYIGKLLDVPPNLGLGANIGFGFYKDQSQIEDFAALTGLSEIKSLPGVPIPAMSINARFGGIILPFDFGIHGFVTNRNLGGSFPDGKLSINTWGVDFRYSLVDQLLVIPSVSVGLAFDHVGFDADIDLNDSVTFNYLVKGNILSGTAQASWKLLFLKPFVGLRILKPVGSDGISASYKVTGSNGHEYIQSAGNSGIHCVLFGGLGLRILVFDNTFGLVYDVGKSRVGGSFSLRLQL